MDQRQQCSQPPRQQTHSQQPHNRQPHNQQLQQQEWRPQQSDSYSAGPPPSYKATADSRYRMNTPPEERPRVSGARTNGQLGEDNYAVPPSGFGGRPDPKRHESNSGNPALVRASDTSHSRPPTDESRYTYGAPAEVRSNIKPQSQSTQVGSWTCHMKAWMSSLARFTSPLYIFNSRFLTGMNK